MSNRAQAQYLRIYTGGTDKQLWQSYYVNSTISSGGKSYSYFPFTADGLMSSSASGGNTVSLTCPATTTAIAALTEALNNQYLVELKVYEFDSRLSNVAPNSNQSLIVNFLGVIISIGGSFETLNVNIGSSISPVGASCPPRKFTTDLIGNPIRL
tara:strand:- start:845 stop:1309 length:465 start_codon:yes stop_codon:yes gene_type:complete